jgi:hypothetical protein
MAASFPLPPLPGSIPFIQNGQISQEWLLYLQRLDQAVKELQTLL